MLLADSIQPLHSLFNEIDATKVRLGKIYEFYINLNIYFLQLNFLLIFDVFLDTSLYIEKLAAFGKSMILLTICGLSFLEMFALLSRIFIAFVCTEILLWASFTFGITYIEFGEQELQWTFNVPAVAITICIFLKVCIGICMRRKLRLWMKSKTFLKRLGKNV